MNSPTCDSWVVCNTLEILQICSTRLVAPCLVAPVQALLASKAEASQMILHCVCYDCHTLKAQMRNVIGAVSNLATAAAYGLLQQVHIMKHEDTKPQYQYAGVTVAIVPSTESTVDHNVL